MANSSPASLAAGIERFLAKRLNGAVSTTAIRATVVGFAGCRVAPAIIREYATLLGEE